MSQWAPYRTCALPLCYAGAGAESTGKQMLVDEVGLEQVSHVMKSGPSFLSLGKSS